MQNIDVRFNASSNFSKVRADLAGLEAQAGALNKVLTGGAYAKPPQLVRPETWNQASAAVNTASRTFRDALSSSGKFTTQQIRATSEAERYTQAIQKQKLSLGEMIKHQGILKQVYQDQLRMQKMSAQYWGTDTQGRAVTDITMPTRVPQELDTWQRRMGFFGSLTKSAGKEIVNLGKNIQWSGRQLTVGLTYPMILFGAAAGKVAYDTEKGFANINKVYDLSAKSLTSQAAKEQELGQLRSRSLAMATTAAQQYGSTLNSTLKVEKELAATGLRGNQLLGTTQQVQRISTLGDMDPQQTTQMVVALQNTMLKGDKSTKHLADTLNYLNATANATSLDLQDIAESVPRAASAFHSLGGTTKDLATILVAMRESGVEAAQGANAIKSASTRIINPVKKAIDIYDQYGIDIQKISKESNGNLFEFLKKLGVEQQKIVGPTKKQTAYLRAQGIAALSGTYQYNRLNAALVNITDAYGGVNNQASKAIELGKRSPAELAKIAKASQDEMMNNPAGKLRQEWAALQIELSKMGVPFLKAGADILSVFTKITKAFNNMPGWIKKIALFGAAGLALAGPLVMLSGLVMNLFGQFFTGIGTIATMVAQFKQLSATWGEAGTIGQRLAGVGQIITKQERAAALTAEQQNKAYATQKAEIASLAEEVAVLTAAYERATIAAQAQMEVIGQIPSSASPAFIGPKTQVLAGHPLTSAEQTAAASIPTYIQGPNGRMAGSLTEAARLERIQAQVAADEKAAAAAAEAAAAANTKNSTALKTAGVASAAMAASMVLMMAPVGHVGQEIGKWGLIGTMAVPALKTAIGLGNRMVSSVSAIVARTIAAAEGTSLLTTGMAAARAGAIGFGVALNEALGPIGWIALGLTAAAGIFMAIKHHNDEISKQQKELLDAQLKANDALNNSAAKFAEYMGKAAGSYQQITQTSPGVAGIGIGGVSANMKAYDYYKNNDEGKKATAGFKDAGGNILGTDLLIDKARQEFIDLQVVGKQTAKQASGNLVAMLEAVGLGARQAQTIVDNVYKHYGDLSKMDWSKPIQDQIKTLKDTAGKGILNSEYNTTAGFTDYTVNDSQVKLVEQQAAKSAQVFNQAIANAASPQKAHQYIKAYMDAALEEWNKGYKAILNAQGGGTDRARAVFTKYGIDSGKAFSTAWAKNADFRKDLNNLIGSTGIVGYGEYIKQATLAGKTWENAMIKPLAKDSNYLSDSINSVVDALIEFNKQGVGVTNKQAANFIKNSPQYQEVMDLQRELANIHVTDKGVGLDRISAMTTELNKKSKSLTVTINGLNKKFGFEQGQTAMQALQNLMNGVKAKTDSADNSVKKLDNDLSAVPSSKNISIGITSDSVPSIVKTAMSGVQGEMASSALASFNASWDSKEAATQAYWQKRQQHAQNAAQDAQDRLQAKFDKRQDKITKAYQKRIDAVNKEIKSEQDADDKREAMYEAEKNRLQHLADMQNDNIDFQTAITEGRLDDAAKIQNNAGAKNAAYQMDKEQAAAEQRTKDTVDRLEKKNDKLEKQRDKELKQLEKMEDRQKKHLDRMQQAREAALERASNADMAAQKKQRDYEEAMLNQRLDLFKSYTARNQSDLEAWMKKVGLSYDDFGVDVKAKGEKWSKYFRTELSEQIRKAGTDVANDAIWSEIGPKMAGQILKGIGFKGMADFKRFVNTGKMSGGGTGGAETHHTGGVVGSGSGSRGNVPNSFKGLHRSEQMVRAQKGEYIVNKDASKKHGSLLSAINSGMFGYDRGNNFGTGGLAAAETQTRIYPGVAGLISGITANMYKAGVEKGVDTGYTKAVKYWAKKAAAMYSGAPGVYGGMRWDKTQMQNAAKIASIGSAMHMGKRDIEIAIMTAMDESSLRNLTGGDRDSAGLFQQRPSQGWGTFAQVTNPDYAARTFYSHLRNVGNRGSMSPWMAAQTVQRSGTPDGSNYERFWGSAEAVFNALKSSGGGGGYIPGTGKKHRPVNGGTITQGLHDVYTGYGAVDIGVPVGSKVYAVNDGKITLSTDLPGSGNGGYRSYGRYIKLKTDSGPEVLYAHLSRRSVSTGTNVAGGAVIGYSGNTGNSTGPHLHFGASNNNPWAWLRQGGTIRYDNTPAILHKGETVLTDALTQQFKKNVASGGGDSYTITVDLRGAVIKDEFDFKKAVNSVIDEREGRLGRKRVIR